MKTSNVGFSLVDRLDIVIFFTKVLAYIFQAHIYHGISALMNVMWFAYILPNKEWIAS